MKFLKQAEILHLCKNRGIHPTSVRVYKMNEVIPFSTWVPGIHGNVFSNMYPCELTWKGIKFNSVEQLFHYSCFKENPEMQAKILACKDGFEVKSLCKGAKRDSNYENMKNKILKACIELKFKQCELFRKLLLDTDDIPLVELAPWGDVEFGTCYCLKNNERWLIGQNACGRLMMQVRLEHREAGE